MRPDQDAAAPVSKLCLGCSKTLVFCTCLKFSAPTPLSTPVTKSDKPTIPAPPGPEQYAAALREMAARHEAEGSRWIARAADLKALADALETER